MVRRQAAKPGDRIFVTGTIGDAALGLRLRLGKAEDAGWTRALDADARAHLAARYLTPQPRLGLRTALLEYASAAMDISDGLVGDCRKLLGGGAVSGLIKLARIPLSDAAETAMARAPGLLEIIVTGGDDYEILCAVPYEKEAPFRTAAGDADIRVTAIGDVENTAEAPVFIGFSGERMHFGKGAFSHF